MQARAFRMSAIAAACLIFGSPIHGQEGHPLAGTWRGDFGASETERKDLTVIMDWDGEELTGLVNPVTDRARLVDARLDSSSWTVRFATDLKDGAGGTMRCIAEGKLDRLGSDQRTLAGSWICDGKPGDFVLTRQRDY